jgi:hypothetical protein
MKTLSRTFAFILLAIIAIVAFMSCVTKFGTYTYVRQIGDPNHIPPIYWRFKKGDDNESDFRKALIALKNHPPTPGACEITFLHTGRHPTPEPHHYQDICEHGGTVNLKTDRVIKSKTANNTAAGQPAANDPNVTWKIQANNLDDINNVMNTLAP